MASSIQILRSSIAKERPFPGNLLDGQPAINTNQEEPGLFFKASDGTIVKFGPAAITSDGNPPNTGGVGQLGNTIGELWLDKSPVVPVLRVYDGSQWIDAGSGGGGGGGGAGSFVRWIYTAVGGETSLSGTSAGVLLRYQPGLEEVFINGALITRGTDYNAISGSSIIDLQPLTAGDVVTVTSVIPLSIVQLPGQVTLLRWSTLATAGQTVLSGSDSASQQLVYTAGLEEVYVNGAFLRRGADYIATNGSTITISVPLTLNDEITVLAWTPFVVAPQPPGQVTLLRWSTLATAGQTALSGTDSSSQQLSYTAGLEEVYVNGAFLRRGVDYTATNGSTITVSTPLKLNDEITVLAWAPFVVGSQIVNADVDPNAGITYGKLNLAGGIVNADVNASAGITSDKLSFTQSGTGAVSRSVDSKLKEVVSVKDFGAACDGITDDTAAVQAAVTYCNTNDKDLEVPGLCLLTGSVNIDRMVDGGAYDHYFTIFSSNGGGFAVASDVAMFSTTLVNPLGAALPVTQMIRFSGLKFEADINSRTAYVLDGNKFLRTTFNGCSFRKIRCLTTGGSTYVQSIYFIACQARRWIGSFFSCTGAACFDVKADSCLMEAGVTAFELYSAVGCSFQQNCIEGMSTGFALILNGAQGTSISGNYFEGNAFDIALNGGRDVLGVSLDGNLFAANLTPGGYNVYWGVNVFNCASFGNYSTDRLHYLETTSQVIINDYAVTAVTNQVARAYFPAKTTEAGDLAIGLQVPTDRGHFHKASNCRVFLSDDVLGSTYGGFLAGYGVVGQGGHAAIGTVEAGTRTNILTVNYAKEVYPSADDISSLGTPSNRWTTVYATTGTINTSDADQKQQIEELSEAEHAVATTIKGLIRKFKFNDAVATKGDDARIHVGVIAQDIEKAFFDAGLDPTRYGLFCHDEWWELDGQIVSESTTGATHKGRLGVRYEELLAFIISSL